MPEAAPRRCGRRWPMTAPMTTGVPGPGGSVPGPFEPGRQGSRTRRRRLRLLAGPVVVVVMAASGAVVWRANTAGGPNESGGRVGAGTSLATVREGPLSTQVYQSGTLSYAGQA